MCSTRGSLERSAFMVSLYVTPASYHPNHQQQLWANEQGGIGSCLTSQPTATLHLGVAPFAVILRYTSRC
ncbi:hypothetical protein FJTKL_11735 [Diaporthe vaccinii]|uniref:Uncharacterized protein n=1 Tax=Diaporthe vaccinii TaxID=105482 RepID=A0ABR4EFU1_9PEZI